MSYYDAIIGSFDIDLTPRVLFSLQLMQYQKWPLLMWAESLYFVVPFLLQVYSHFSLRRRLALPS